MSIETLRDLVAIQSVAGDEELIAAYVADKCEKSSHSVTRIGNSIAAYAPGQDSSKAFILNGHLDTVPVVEGWQTDPFILSRDPHDPDKLRGLATSDMKAGVGIMLDYAEALNDNRPSCDTWLFFTSREEVDNQGAKDLTDWFASERHHLYSTIGGLILEPTVEDNGRPFIGVGHRNGLLLEVTAQGHDGHGSQRLPDGATAIEKMSLFIANGLPRIRAEWQRNYSHELLGAPTLNPTGYSAGLGRHNIISRTATATFDLRTTPALNEVLDVEIAKLEQEHGVTVVSPWKPAETICPAGAHILKAVQAGLPELPLKAFPAATDLFAFLEHNIPMLIFGPGEIAAMHQPNEWVRQSAIRCCKQTIGMIARQF